MGRRLLPALIAAITLIAGACATRSERVTTRPQIPTSLIPHGPGDVGAGKCVFTVGAGMGAAVNDVFSAGPADGTLRVDDVVTALDGTPIRTSADLAAAVQQRSVGDRVTVEATRDGEPISVEVTLGESGEVTGRALLGVLTTTVEERLEPDTLAAHALEGDLVRLVDVAGELWLLDPAGVDWSPLDLEAPGQSAVPLEGEVYTVSQEGLFAVRVDGLVAGTSIVVELDDWEPRAFVGTLGSYLLVAAERTDLDGTSLGTSVIAVDPVAAAVAWAWIVDPFSGAPAPVIGYRSLDGERTLVGMGATFDDPNLTWILLSEVGTAPVVALARGISATAFVLGWHDDDRVMTIEGPIDEASLVDPDTGVVEETTLPLSGAPTGLWPVGDGEHVLAEEGDGLVLATVGAPGRRELTASCGESLVSEVGWAGGVNRRRT